MFFKREGWGDSIEAGSKFRRVRRDHTIETARVLSVRSDGLGIPHVRYELAFEIPRACERYVDSQRVLALSAFARRYGERVAS